VGGTDTLRGSAFQIVQALSDVVALLTNKRFAAIRIEGQDDAVDYEALDADDRRIAVWQAKTRQDSDSWGAAELAAILLEWDRVDEASITEFTFVTDGRLGPSGQGLNALIKAFQENADSKALLGGASTIGRHGVTLPSPAVVRRVRILCQLGNSDDVLARLEMQILRLIERSRVVTSEDAADAANRLFRIFFLVGGRPELARRVVTRAEIVDILGISEASLLGGLAWSAETATAYRIAIAQRRTDQTEVLMPCVQGVAAEPSVLRLASAATVKPTNEQASIDTVLTEPVVGITGFSGTGKTVSLTLLTCLAAENDYIPIYISAAGHAPGSLPNRIRGAIESVLSRRLSPGAVERVLALPELLLLIDGISEVPEAAQNALRSDLEKLNAQRPLRVIAAGRDLPVLRSVLQVLGEPVAYRLTPLTNATRRELAGRLQDKRTDIVETLERKLGDAVDNPLLFLMALGLSDDCVPSSRAAVYEQFLCGLTTRSGVAYPELTLSAFGVAWARLIELNRRTTDHYDWMTALSQASLRLGEGPIWRGERPSGKDLLARGEALGLVSRTSPDGGLAPLHDSFADFLAGRSMARGYTPFPTRLSTEFDEAILFAIEIAGLEDGLALRLASENPLLACRVSRMRNSGSTAEIGQLICLLNALVGDSNLPVFRKFRGLRLHHNPSFTGVVLVEDGNETIDSAGFDCLVDNHPAIMVPPETTSLQLALRLWATAMSKARRPEARVFQELPPFDQAAAAIQVEEYARSVDSEISRLVNSTIPASIRERVELELGPRGIVAVVGEPEPAGLLRNLETPMKYQRGHRYQVITSSQGNNVDDGLAGSTSVENFMRRHPTHFAADEIGEALNALSDYSWPER
jgi:hypothetical protein